MQTFLPHIGWNASLKCLDNQRLGKQRVEAKQILMVLGGDSEGYQHHPAVNMWRGYERALCWYGAAACYQWRIVRKKNCELYPWFPARDKLYGGIIAEVPPWCQDAWFMRSHRSNLIRKDPGIYAGVWPKTPENMPYLWPVNDHSQSTGYRLTISLADFKRLEDDERVMPDALQVDEKTRNVTVK